jgi:hypothetical protein
MHSVVFHHGRSGVAVNEMTRLAYIRLDNHRNSKQKGLLTFPCPAALPVTATAPGCRLLLLGGLGKLELSALGHQGPHHSTTRPIRRNNKPRRNVNVNQTLPARYVPSRRYPVTWCVAVGRAPSYDGASRTAWITGVDRSVCHP